MEAVKNNEMSFFNLTYLVDIFPCNRSRTSADGNMHSPNNAKP